MSEKWDLRFVEMARLVASWSKDPSTKVGAVIVDHERRVVSVGYNGFPRHVVDSPERYADKTVKYQMVVHAEANAILNANKSVCDCTLYVTKFCCSECAKLIIQSGVARVLAPRPDFDHPQWGANAHVSAQMLREACVSVHEITLS